MKTSLQVPYSIIAVASALTLMAAPAYSAWATTAPWPLSTITVSVTGPIQPAQSDGRGDSDPANSNSYLRGVCGA